MEASPTLHGQASRSSRRDDDDVTVTSVQKCMAYTYYNLRWGLAVLALLFPAVLGLSHYGRPRPESISGYYHTGMRNYFVATLVALGMFLVLYRGFSRGESWILNLAGGSVILVAFLPTSRETAATDPPDTFTAPHAHGVFALIAFGCMAIVTWFFGPRTLGLIENEESQKRYRHVYHGLAILMVVLPVICWVLAYQKPGGLFWVETAALYVFVGYWLTKTKEFRGSKAETRAIAGEIVHDPPPSQGRDSGDRQRARPGLPALRAATLIKRTTVSAADQAPHPVPDADTPAS